MYLGLNRLALHLGFCAPGGIRTPNLPGRNRMLCPLSYRRVGERESKGS
jgi:hypothetical protein